MLASVSTLLAQSNSGIVSGTVTDPVGAVIPGAIVSISNPVSGYSRSMATDSGGHFQFTNLPLNSYHLAATANGFGAVAQDARITSSIPVTMTIALKVEGSSTSVTVEAEDLVSNDPLAHTNVDRNLFNRLPLESQSSSLSSLVTLASPGVAADSNGLFHGLGDHASNSFSIDGQPITDQQSKVFSNQIPSNAIQSIEAIPGAPTAEYGGKTSLIINVTTRSGQGSTTPHGSITSSYGSFGSATGASISLTAARTGEIFRGGRVELGPVS
ncbi:carboxypeptidase regulatory-like domain-containing protein [Tunturiibacter gelidiferens]|uniref:carboxypeptidase-like regulatory domain-containing protein n=1 Tax=Tunturiibacter gelidiferens TaxID=3069689 RepID=UPI003D9B1639